MRSVLGQGLLWAPVTFVVVAAGDPLSTGNRVSLRSWLHWAFRMGFRIVVVAVLAFLVYYIIRYAGRPLRR